MVSGTGGEEQIPGRAGGRKKIEILSSEENCLQCSTVSQKEDKSEQITKEIVQGMTHNLVGRPVCSAAQFLPHEVNGVPEIDVLI